MKKLVWILLIVLLFEQCKSLRTVPDSRDVKMPVEADTVAIDSLPVDTTTYYVTQKGDSLTRLDSVVAKSTRRVLRDTITLKAVGDIMMGTNFPSPSYLPPDMGEKLWSVVSPSLQDADFTFGNLEGVILNDGGEQKECNNPKACYLFRTPDEYAYHFIKHGFDLLSLANNHANDFGKTGRLNTQKVLDSLNIAHAGSEESPTAIIIQKGIKIGFLAMAPNRGTISIHNETYAINKVRQLDSLTDIVVVSLHIGAEGSKNQNITRTREFYYGEDRGNVYELSRLLIDNGADVILGHGPHVVRAVDIYKDKFIAYSLGNFLTYGRFNLRGPNAYAPILRLDLDADGRFISGEIESYIQDYSLGPIKDFRNRAALTMKELTEIDFPESSLLIDEKGKISYLNRSK
jgi:poly-gamma-glutamate capsule biosynthesis protein CapA/YwtB (metallophosphatase superfamily)